MHFSYYCIRCVLLLFLPGCCYSILKFPKCDYFDENGQTTALCGLCFTKRFLIECGPLCTSKCETSVKKPKSTSDDSASKLPQRSKAGGSATGSLTRTCNGIEPCVDIDTANQYFRQCCDTTGIPRSCSPVCKYNVTRNELQDAVLRGKCPVDKLRSYLDCASNRKDNTPCCKSLGVLDKNRSICRPLCDSQGRDWPESEDEARRLLPCLGQFGPIMRCHWASVRK